MPEIVLSAPLADLDVSHNTDWDIDVSWWEQDGTTPINITAVAGEIRTHTDVLLDLADFSTITGNLIQLRVPAVEGNKVEHGEYRWFLTATSTDGETKGLLRGKARIRP
jgi:hypothetical protein